MKARTIEFLKEIYDDCTVNGSHRIKARQLLESLEPQNITLPFGKRGIREGEIHNAARKCEDYIVSDSELDQAESAGRYHGFKKGVKWAIKHITNLDEKA